MEESHVDISTSNEHTEVKIYTKNAIKGFAFFFTTIFGGVLLYSNLMGIGKPKEARISLFFSMLYTGLSMYLVNIPDRPQTSITYLLNLIGGVILTEYFYKTHMGETDGFEKKKIWKPLIISLLITIPLFWAMLQGY